MGLQMLQVLMLLAVMTVVVTGYPRTVTKVLQTTAGSGWGSWGLYQFCPSGTYARGFKLKVESPCGSCDDTALNAIELICGKQDSSAFHGTLHSLYGLWGNFRPKRTCLNGYYFTRFRLDVEPNRGSGDDTAVNNISFKCRRMNTNVGTFTLYGNSPAPWGTRQRWSSQCPLGSAICGMRTKVEGRQGSGDDTTLNDVKLYCCK